MEVFVSLDHRFESTPDGHVWTISTYDYAFLKRYLDVFEKVFIIARVKETEKAFHANKRADGEGIEFIPIPSYVGPREFVGKYLRIRKVLKSIDTDGRAVIARVPGTISNLFLNRRLKRSHPYALEVIGDPRGNLARGAIKHPLRIFFKWWFTSSLKRQCRGAVAVSYVTEEVLQQRYPTKTYSVGISSIVLEDSAFASRPREFPQDKKDFTVIFIGFLENLVKAPDILIDAVEICVRNGADIRLRIIGDGKNRHALSERESALLLGDRISFLGRLPPGAPIIGELDKADLFVLPSRQEGLPRVVIEAMARGLPCIGTRVGGIPELLQDDFLVQPGNVAELAQKIMQVIGSPELMSRASNTNLEKAKEFRSENLQKKRGEFYSHIESATLSRFK